ncbi:MULTISPECIES: sensor histidine kinase [Bradyrhizobium]|uniref:sensor histidine kinase n=1 Tax=Bradyrhizobium TaxID=374 RepID=UPI00131E0178|nr:MULTISPECIES: ATP-binding protein [Bradyrhizobium]UFW48204.1 ATP-binding protein [Bradyrhizobium arachidis]
MLVKRAEKEPVSRGKKVALKSRTAEPSLDELLAFERLLSDLSARFANVGADQVVAEIETALRQLFKFLGFARGTFGEFSDGGQLSILCSAAAEGLEPVPRGPVTDFRKWAERELYSGRTITFRSWDDYPVEVRAAVDEHYRQRGIVPQLLIPLTVDGNVVAMIAFVAFQSSREWPDEFIARIKVIGEVMAQALVRKRSEAELRATQSELARVRGLTAVGQMAASIAHEINQPLGAIVTNGNAGLRWLSNPRADHLEQVRTALERVVREGNRASQVINGIRAMFKNDSREKATLDVNHLIREVLAILDSELRSDQVQVQAELMPDPLPVFADRVQLQQVVANLIANAIEAMSTVSGRARTLRVRTAISKPDSALISVEDSGPGIDRENLGHIFHPFFTTKPQGMGMGLAICRSIVESHGGSLSASPGHPHGAVFRVVLPTGRVDRA